MHIRTYADYMIRRPVSIHDKVEEPKIEEHMGSRGSMGGGTITKDEILVDKFIRNMKRNVPRVSKTRQPRQHITTTDPLDDVGGEYLVPQVIVKEDDDTPKYECCESCHNKLGICENKPAYLLKKKIMDMKKKQRK